MGNNNVKSPLVSIRCLVYNHEPFLRECLDGFIMQKTEFTFEVIVHDDASTDGSAAIIREYAEKYPDIIKPIYETENQYSKRDGSLQRIMNAAIHPAVKYIAMCEGDDYWTEPYKLQKQVDFLETHLDYSLCCHRYRIYNQNTDTWEDDYVAEKFKEYPDGFSFSNKENFECWITKTMTLMFRVSEQLWQSLQQYSYTRDVHLNYHLLKQGKGYCFSWDGAVYRKHDGGVFSLKNNEYKSDIAYIIYRELWIKNQEDTELYEHWLAVRHAFFYILKMRLYNHDIDRVLVGRIFQFLMDEYTIKRAKGVMRVLKRIFLMYFESYHVKSCFRGNNMSL